VNSTQPTVDVAVRRWETYTGKHATLVGTGQRFEEVEELRQSTTINPSEQN
jgi:hypothetical protein